MKPPTQMHDADPSTSRQIPEFWHGFEVQASGIRGLGGMAQLRPVYPLPQMQNPDTESPVAITGKVGFTVGTDVVTWTLALVSTRNKFVGHTVSTTLARSGAAGIGDLSFTVDSTEERGTNALLSNSRRGAHSTILARLNRAGGLDGKENQKRKGQI